MALKLSKHSWIGKIFQWYLDHGGRDHGNLCPTMRAVLFWAPLKFFLEAGFLTEHKFIRPLTVLLYGLGAYCVYVGIQLKEYFLLSYGVIIIINTVVLCFIEGVDGDDMSELHPIVELFVFLMCAVVLVPILLCVGLYAILEKLFDMADLDGRIRRGYRKVEPFLKRRVYRKTRVWHILLLLIWAAASLQWPVFYSWSLFFAAVVGGAVVCILIVHRILSLLLDFLGEKISERSNRSYWDESSKPKPLKTKGVILVYIQSLHDKICPQIEWVDDED